MNIAEIEEIILGFLAEDAGFPAEQLRAELVGGGRHMPVDSVLAVSVLVRVQDATGVRLPATADTAVAMRSVHAFALAVAGQLGAGHGQSVSA